MSRTAAPVPVRDPQPLHFAPLRDPWQRFWRRSSTRWEAPAPFMAAACSRTPGRRFGSPRSRFAFAAGRGRLRYYRVSPSARSALSSPRHSPLLHPGGPGAMARRHPAGLRGSWARQAASTCRTSVLLELHTRCLLKLEFDLGMVPSGCRAVKGTRLLLRVSVIDRWRVGLGPFGPGPFDRCAAPG